MSYVATRIKLNSSHNEDCHDIILDKLTDFCYDNGFLCCDKVGEVHEEECRDIPYSLMTLIKQMAVELCRDISQLCRDVKK